MNFGKYLEESNEAYHASGAISKTKLDDFLENPKLFYRRHVSKVLPRESRSAALVVGDMVHTLTLEGLDAFNAKFAIDPPDAPNRPSSRQRGAKKPSPETIEAIRWWDAFEAENKGKEIVSGHEFTVAQRVNASINQHPTASALLANANNEKTFRVQGPRFAIQCRPDSLNVASEEVSALLKAQGIDLPAGATFACDIKTTESVADFAKSFLGWNYHRSAPFYSAVLADLGVSVDKFFFIVAEKQEPFDVAIFLPTDETNQRGWSEVVDGLRALNDAYRTDTWPGAPLSVQPISLPRWYLKKEEAA